MSLIQVQRATIYDVFKTLIEQSINTREKTSDKDIQQALNLSIILHSACYIEGFLEYSLLNVLQEYRNLYNKVDISEFEIRKPINMFFSNMENSIERNISRSSGLAKYDENMVLLLNQSIMNIEKVKPHIETVQVLFQLRNVIAHGKAISGKAILKVSQMLENDNEIENDIKILEEKFEGGYKKAESYLIKKGLVMNPYFEEKEIDNIFLDELFSNCVADHFWDTTTTFVTELENFINEQRANLASIPIKIS